MKTVRGVGAKIIVVSSASSQTDAGAVTVSFPTSNPKSISLSSAKAQPTDVNTRRSSARWFGDVRPLPAIGTVFAPRPESLPMLDFVKRSAVKLFSRQGARIHHCPLLTMVDSSSGSNSTNEIASGAQVHMLAVGHLVTWLMSLPPLQTLHWLHFGTPMTAIILSLALKAFCDLAFSICDRESSDTLVFCLFLDHTMFLRPQGLCTCPPSSGTFFPSSLSSEKLIPQFSVKCHLQEPSLTTFSEVAPHPALSRHLVYSLVALTAACNH